MQSAPSILAAPRKRQLMLAGGLMRQLSQLIRLIPAVALLSLTLMAPAAAATAPTRARTVTASARASVVSFWLAPPNTAVAPARGMMAAPGDWIKVTGGGTVTVGGAARAQGRFVHYNADGTVHCRGWWKATAVTGWTGFGGGRHGRHGGVLSPGHALLHDHG